ncbi:hypothetical protein ACQPX6_19185 [Actinomycetospora sp. CA-101289]|uniref:hypothetical protein n=1 Tax=Actinomycetospora sp. CA-101289 TaxID=3239893 RepID=UPI003D96441B
MSGADRTWRITVDGTEHEIRVAYSMLTAGITVHHDGELVARDRLFMSAKRFDLDLGSSRATVEVYYPDEDDVASRLFLDGQEVASRPA